PRPSPSGVDEQAVPQLVPIDQLEPPGLVKEIKPLGEAADDATRVEDRPGDAGDGQPVTHLGRRLGDVEQTALVELHADPGPRPLMPGHGDVDAPGPALVEP